VNLMIETIGIVKAFGATRALDDVTLSVKAGQVVALLGPNGAGKTTLVRILTTLVRPDSGSARIAGLDVLRDAAAVRPLVGATGQFAAIDPLLTGRENLAMIGELCHLGRRRAASRASELLRQFALTDAADRLAGTYSGGMSRRLDLAASLIAEPPVLVLDEPTTGLDPRSRMDMWSAIERLAAGGTTVLLTTQYLEEADRLAHWIVVLNRGRVAAEGTPGELKANLNGHVLELRVGLSEAFDTALAVVTEICVDEPITDRGRGRITITARAGADMLRAVLRRLEDTDVAVDDIALRRPSLDEVFLTLTAPDASVDDVAAAEQAGVVR
jgi:ABC-2 type transport system ATP-binding protein